jgi:hypothetical protein
MEKNTKSNGATVGLIIIVLLLVVGGAYTWKSKLQNDKNNQQIFAPITVEDEAELNALLEDLGTTESEANTESDIENLE